MVKERDLEGLKILDEEVSLKRKLIISQDQDYRERWGILNKWRLQSASFRVL